MQYIEHNKVDNRPDCVLLLQVETRLGLVKGNCLYQNTGQPQSYIHLKAKGSKVITVK